MARTPTTPIPLGFTAPDFSLPDTISGKQLSLNELRGEHATVVMFICNHCPFVKHVDQGIIDLANDYSSQGISFIAISSNDVENYPQDHPDLMKVEAARLGYPFPYLYDASQEVAKAYSAACTPDFSIFDQDLVAVYRGQLDDARPGNGLPVNGSSIRAALDALLEGREVNSDQKPSIGCNIKWKS
ncbi:MAG: thioredoxin family protein [Saprospiraceae bacterium]|nr:thioredoxin family protein [Saprospiraceae bacterium]